MARYEFETDTPLSPSELKKVGSGIASLVASAGDDDEPTDYPEWMVPAPVVGGGIAHE